MRVPINLATHPLENLRPLRIAALLAAAALLIVSVALFSRERRNRNEFRSLTEQSQSLQREISALQNEQQELQSWLATPEVQQIRNRSSFLNFIILQKSLSWTQMFMDLERTLPPRAWVVGIRPSLGPAQDGMLAFTVAAESLEPLVQFVRNLEESPQFGTPAVGAQRFAPAARGQQQGAILLDVTARYQPGVRGRAGEERPPAGDGKNGVRSQLREPFRSELEAKPSDEEHGL